MSARARSNAAIAIALVVATGAAPAHGATGVSAGWWTAAPVALAPDAPDGALVVQGGATGALSYAAMAFDLGPGEAPASLTLRVEGTAVSTPNTTLALCPLTEVFEPASGAPVADAPSFDCTVRVEALVLPDGETYRFDVAGLVAGARLAVAVLPTAPTDRVVLAEPAATDLAAAGLGVPAPIAPGEGAAGPVPAGPPAPGGLPPGVPAGGAGTPAGLGVPRPGLAVTVPPAASAPPAAAAAGAAPATATGPGAVASSLLTGEASDGSTRLQVLFVGLAGAAAFLWLRRPTVEEGTTPASA